MFKKLFLAFSVVCVSANLAWAAGSSDNSSKASKGPDLSAAEAQIEAGQYAAAIMSLTAIVEEHPDSADAFNLIGYSYRQQQNYPKSLEYYAEALRINPKHKGAHEYLGTAYVEMGDLDKANEHLQALDDICLFNCAELKSLRAKIEAATGS